LNSRRNQTGLTLVMSLIMLIVLTLLVVSAIRFSNINLRLAGNAQTQAESAAAAQVAIEQVIQSVLAGTTNLSSVATTTTTVSTGGASYTVTVSKPKCNMNQNVDTTTLDPSKASDRACFGLGSNEAMMTSSGGLTSGPSACKDQMWDIAASVGDTASGSNVNMLQGVSLRVGAEVSCPST
jgi:Tfp pilus assembly protein PilX